MPDDMQAEPTSPNPSQNTSKIMTESNEEMITEAPADQDDALAVSSELLDRKQPRMVATAIANVVVAALLIGGGVKIAKKFLAGAEPPERVTQEDLGELVVVSHATHARYEASFTERGQVTPAREFVVIPQVAGTIETLSDGLVVGGTVAQGEVLLEIDRRTYRTLVSARRAELAQAQAGLEVEQGLGALATQEWDTFSGEFAAGEAGPLTLREPQRAQADASVEAAETRLALARIDLNRTRIEAPFDAYVRMENVEVGQYVAPGMQLASLVATDEAWIEVSIPVERLDELAIPGVNAVTGGTVEVRAVGRGGQTWTGRVLRLMGDLDPAGRQARLIVSVEDPWGLQSPEGERPIPLLNGSYVEVTFPLAAALDGVEIPRSWLRNGDHVWVASEGRLQVRDVEIGARDEDTVIIVAGLSDGDAVVTSRLSVPIDGMLLRVTDSPEEGGTTEGGDHE